MSVNGITSRRRPWPYDAYIGPVRTRLAPIQGQLVTEKTKTLDATAPIDYTYGSANPFKERTSEWQDLFGGFGQAEAPASTPRRYDHAEYVDASIDGLWMLGPRFEDHIESIDDTPAPGEVRQLVKALHGGALTVFAICENGVWRRSGDGSWVESLTTATTVALPAGTHPQQALRFKHRGVTPLDAMYLATDNTNLYRYDGATWTVAGAAAGPGTGGLTGEARWLERVGDEFWVAGDYWVVKCEDDPMNRPNYSGVIWIGDQTAKVTQIKQIENTLYIWKEDGIYTVDQDGVDVDLFPTLRYRNNSSNGKNASVWIDRIWFTYGDQTLMLDSQATLKPDGFEQMLENTSIVRGQWIGGAGHNTWFFYEVYYNTAINTSFLVKHGTWVEETSSASKPGVSQYAEAHHGAIYQWNKRATSATVVSGLHTGGNDRLYIGFSNGTVEWTPLPRHSPNPAEDTNCFIGSTEVDAEDNQGASRRWYDGEIIEITTSNGYKLSGTPNHPILTERGWVALGELVEGTRVFSRSRGEKLLLADPDEQDRGIPIEQVFDFAALLGSIMRKRGTNQQFHGDGRDTQVDVVATDGLLGNRVQTQLPKPRHQQYFSPTDEQLLVLSSPGNTSQKLRVLGTPANRSVSRLSLGQPLLRSLPQRTQGIGLLSASDRHAPSLQVFPDVMRGQIVATSEGLSRLPTKVEPDHVVSVQRKLFSGHVYNLQTSGHWYFANNIIAHNCEFTSKPAYMYLPLHHSGFRADNKLYHGITAFGPRLTTAEWVEVEYRLDVTNSLASWLPFSTGVDARFTYPGQRQQFSSSEATNPVYGTAIMLRIALKKNPDTTISPKYLTPMLHGIGVHESIRPAFSREFTFIVAAKSYMALRDGKVDRRRGSDIYAALLQQAQEVGTVIMLLPTGSYEEMTIIDWHDTSVPENLRRDFEWAVQVHAIQLRTRSSVSGSTVGGEAGGGSSAPPPVTGGFTYDTLEQYTLDQLESII